MPRLWCWEASESDVTRRRITLSDVFRYDSDAFWRQSLALYAKAVTSLTHLHRIVRKGLTDRKLAKRVICKSAAYTASVVVSCWPARAYTAKMAAPRKQGRKSWYFSGSPCAASRSYAHERTRLVSFRILSWRNSPGAPSWWRKVDGMSDFDFTLVQQHFPFSDRILLSNSKMEGLRPSTWYLRLMFGLLRSPNQPLPAPTTPIVSWYGISIKYFLHAINFSNSYVKTIWTLPFSNLLSFSTLTISKFFFETTFKSISIFLEHQYFCSFWVKSLLTTESLYKCNAFKKNQGLIFEWDNFQA